MRKCFIYKWLVQGQFAEEILEAVRTMGQEIKVLPPEMQWLQMGGWVGIKIDPETGKRKGGVPLDLNGIPALFQYPVTSINCERSELCSILF